MDTRKRWTDQQWGVGAVVVAAIAFAVLVIIASTAAAFVSTTIIDVPSATRYGQDNIFTEPTGHDGETCLVTLTETNEDQPSANAGNYLTLTTGDVYLVLDIETERGGFGETSIIGTVGATATLAWHIDRVSSAGASVTIDCEGETPSTTTTTTSTTSSTPPVEPSTTTTTEAPSTSTTSTTVPESSSTTTTSVVTTPSSSSTVAPTTRPTQPGSSTVPVIPSGVPTGTGSDSPPLWPGLLLSALGVGALAILAGLTWRATGGEDD